MNITLSKSQWEGIGKKAGWMKDIKVFAQSTRTPPGSYAIEDPCSILAKVDNDPSGYPVEIFIYLDGREFFISPMSSKDLYDHIWDKHKNNLKDAEKKYKYIRNMD
jgi:hypothetical protein